jgi:hypothetical protein
MTRKMALTEILSSVTPAFASLVCLSLRTMLEWLVSITNVIEELKLVFASKQCGAKAVNGSVSPTLRVEPGESCENK